MLLLSFLCLTVSTTTAKKKSLVQYDQVGAEENGTLNVALLKQWLSTTNANTFSFLLWDTDGHQYLDMVRFLNQSRDFRINGEPLDVWVTLIPPSETQHPPRPAPNFTNCAHCPVSHPYVYGGGGFDGRPATGGGFCCPVQSPDHEHCPGSAECCLAPIPGSAGCEGIRRCGSNPHNHTACPPNRTRRVPPSRRHSTSFRGVPKGEERCSVPADSPLTPFNETALVNTSKGWRGCDDYEGWGDIIGRLAAQYPMLKTMNIDDFSSNVPQVFTAPYITAIKAGLAQGGVSLIPTFYYPAVHIPWLLKATDGALFYFRNDKEGQAQCGQPSNADGGLCAPPKTSGGIQQRKVYSSSSSSSRSSDSSSGSRSSDSSSSSSSSSKATTNTTTSEVTSLGSGGVGELAGKTKSPIPCTACCLSGVRAETSLKNIGSEIADFTKGLPLGHSLHIGLYNSGYSHCVSPSAAYDRQALIAALGNPAVAGVTVYTTQVPKAKCLPPAELEKENDKGCIVQQIFANYSK